MVKESARFGRDGARPSRSGPARLPVFPLFISIFLTTLFATAFAEPASVAFDDAQAAVAASDDLDVARQALRDGLWSVARAHAAKAGDGEEARLVQLESWAAEGKWDEVAKALGSWSDTQSAAFEYYRAVLRGDFVEAARILKAGGSAAGLVYAQLYEAERRAKRGDASGAQALWRAVCAQTNVSARAFATAAANLMDPDLLRRAQCEATDAPSRRALTLRLGVALLSSPATAAEGVALVRAVAKDAPDTPGAREALFAVADAELKAGRWKEARELYAEAVEIWPDAAKRASVQDGLGWSSLRLGRLPEALEAFERSEQVAETDAARAASALCQGDVLTALGRTDDAMARYRRALAKYPATPAAARLSNALHVREREAKGRELYRAYRFSEAREVFREVAADDASRAPRMRLFEALCLYGAGDDDAAERAAEALLADCPDARVKADARLWLAKLKFNRRDWKAAGKLFAEASETPGLPVAQAAEALLWAARAAFAESDHAQAIALTTKLVKRFPTAPARLPALLLQGETLNALARFDEAVLVFERVAAAADVTAADRARARVLKADALFAMGADDAARYTAALEAYRAILFGGDLSPSERLVVSFKIARALEKLKRPDEALDQYYTQVVLAYRRARLEKTRLDEDARAVFSKAAFRLADEFESRGKDRQAVAVLDLVATSDSSAADEARKRIRRLTEKGGML